MCKLIVCSPLTADTSSAYRIERGKRSTGRRKLATTSPPFFWSVGNKEKDILPPDVRDVTKVGAHVT